MLEDFGIFLVLADKVCLVQLLVMPPMLTDGP